MKEKMLKTYTIGVYDPYLRPLIYFSDYPGGTWVKKYSSYYRRIYKNRKIKLFRSDEEYNAARNESDDQKKRDINMMGESFLARLNKKRKGEKEVHRDITSG